MLDRRCEQRCPAYLGGRISFSERLPIVDCLIRSISPRGARLVVEKGCFVPDEFDLEIPCKQVCRRVQARWRRSDVIGVEITTLAARTALPLDHECRIKQLEAENRRLKNDLRQW